MIDDDEVRLEPAGDLWGLPNRDAQERLRERLGADFQIATIGPAGERLVRYATISHDGRHAGRGGSGAVLGAKNIKAIAVRGSRRCDWADPPGLVALAKRLSAKSFGPATAKYRELGTASNLLTFNRLNVLPTRNFQQGSFAGAAAISPEELSAARERSREPRAPPARSAASIFTACRTARARFVWSTRTCSPSARCAASTIRTSCSRPADAATSWDSTRSAPAARSRLRWSAPNAGYLDEPWLRFGDGAALLQALDLIVSRRRHWTTAGRRKPPDGTSRSATIRFALRRR